MSDPFRDPSLAEKARAEREAEAAQLKLEAKARDDAEAAKVRERNEARWRERGIDLNPGRRTGALVTGAVVVAMLAWFVVGGGRKPEPGSRPVTVEPGDVRSSSATAAEDVRALVARHAEELAKCFDDGLASGALVLGKGPAKTFAFDWTIEKGGAVTKVSTSHAGEPSEAEACMLAHIQVWWFEGVSDHVDVTGWRFERCAPARGECVHPKELR